MRGSIQGRCHQKRKTGPQKEFMSYKLNQSNSLLTWAFDLQFIFVTCRRQRQAATTSGWRRPHARWRHCREPYSSASTSRLRAWNRGRHIHTNAKEITAAKTTRETSQWRGGSKNRERACITIILTIRWRFRRDRWHSFHAFAYKAVAE